MLELLLEICRHGQDWDCVRAHAQAFAAAVAAAPEPAAVLQDRRTAAARYFTDLARWSAGEKAAAILASGPLRQDNAFDGDLYLRRQLLTARLRLDAGDRAGFEQAIDRALSLVASLTAPQDGRRTVAYGLVEAMGLLSDAGEAERAYGLYRAAGPALGAALGSEGFDALLYRVTQAQLLQQMGDAAGAASALDTAAALARRLEMDEGARTRLLSQILTLRAATGLAAGDLDAAAAALREHPLAGRLLSGSGEAGWAYLAARLLLANASAAGDADALEAVRRSAPSPRDEGRAGIYRSAALTLAAPAGPERRRAAADLARRLRAEAGNPGPWRRPGVVERLLIGVALQDGGEGLPPALAFDLFQLAGRIGPSHDADAAALMSRARNEAERRTVHQMLRLTARRDRLLREQVQKVAGGLGASPTDSAALRHDAATRRQIADFDRRIARARAALSSGGFDPDHGPLVTLADFQKTLAPDEAALAVAPVVGGRAYACVRRESVFRLAALTDEARLKLDGRLVQQALSAGHAPSLALDSQYPVAAAVRLYDGLLRPFEPCLKTGDTLDWLGAPAGAAPPLAALLASPPPKRGEGYDLAAAEWVARRYAVTYAGSAAALTAARRGPARSAADFDFLGVGEPVLAGPGAAADASLAALPPLLDTRPELEESAKPYPASRLLLASAATERALRRELLGHYRFLSFATHGLMRDDLQGLAEPALVLTPVRADDAWDNGLLTAAEIADLDLRAAFVALSACNTANADPQVLGQDLPALTSAFAVAGAPSVLATLWPVDSLTGRRVVARTFEALQQAGVGPATALAQAQRAFLAAPPSSAYLHPRFWAPFVVVGDGGARPAPEHPNLRVTAVETVTRISGEVLALQPAGGGLAASFIGDPDAAGRHAAGLRSATRAGEVWSRATTDRGASPILTSLGGHLLSAGFAAGGDGRYAPVLALTDMDGRELRRWTAPSPPELDGFPLAGVALGPAAAALAVGEFDLRTGGAGGRLRVVRTEGDLKPRDLFQIVTPAGGRILGSALASSADRLLVAVSYAGPSPPAPEGLDDYDLPACPSARWTLVQLRTAEGALLAERRIEGFTAAAALSTDRRMLLGGSRMQGCEADAMAEIVALDGRLAPTTAWRDAAFGASDVRAMAHAGGGAVWVAATKASVVDFRPVGEALTKAADPFALRPTGASHAVLLLRLGADGQVAASKLVEAGSDVLADALAPTADGALALGGAVGGRAAVLHLSSAAR